VMSFIHLLDTILLLPKSLYTVSTQSHIVTFLVSGLGLRVMQMFPLGLLLSSKSYPPVRIGGIGANRMTRVS
jgi:hypothetical protein